jgi:hypothetical protein
MPDIGQLLIPGTPQSSTANLLSLNIRAGRISHNNIYLAMTDKNRSELLALTTQLLDSSEINLLIGMVSLNIF